MTPEQISQSLIEWLEAGAQGYVHIYGALDVREQQEPKNINILVMALPETDYWDDTPGDTK